MKIFQFLRRLNHSVKTSMYMSFTVEKAASVRVGSLTITGGEVKKSADNADWRRVGSLQSGHVKKIE